MNKQELHARFGPKMLTALPGPRAKAAVEADDRLISPSYTRSYPLVAKSGRGIRVTDVDGNEFMDFAAGIAVTSTCTFCQSFSAPGDLRIHAGTVACSLTSRFTYDRKPRVALGGVVAPMLP